MMQNGFVKDFQYEPETFILSEPVYVHHEYQDKTAKGKVKIVSKDYHVLHGMNYTPDFKIVFEKVPECMKKNPYIRDNVWWIDTKGSYNGKNNQSAITFPLKAKILWEKHGILVEKFVPKAAFKKYGVPNRYLYTDITLEKRRIPFPVKEIR